MGKYFFFLYIFRGFCVNVPLPPLRGQHTVLCHSSWLPTSGLPEFAVCWGGAGFKPRTTDLQSGALPLSHLSSSKSHLSSSNISDIVKVRCCRFWFYCTNLSFRDHAKFKNKCPHLNPIMWFIFNLQRRSTHWTHTYKRTK